MGGVLLGDMSLTGVDLDAHCQRIGYTGPRTATLSALREVLRLHPAAIPYDAIHARLGVPIDLAPAVVDAKLIAGRRGGYCFEQNTLLLRVLLALGFHAEPLSARPRWRRPPHEHVARTHMAVRVRAYTPLPLHGSVQSPFSALRTPQLRGLLGLAASSYPLADRAALRALARAFTQTPVVSAMLPSRCTTAER